MSEPDEERARPDAPRPRFVIVGGSAAPSPGQGRPNGSASRGVLGTLRTLGSTLREQALEWCADRSWEVRVPVMVYLVYVLVQHWGNLEYTSMLGGLNLGVHEAGHILFSPFGEFMTIAGGTILQCLVPFLVMASFYKTQKDFFAIAFCFGWLATSLFGCGTYAADARGQLNLILVSPWGQGFGADGIGDWSRMLGKLGMLEWDGVISSTFRLTGSLSMIVGLALGGWLMWEMARLRRAEAAAKSDRKA